MFLAVVVASFLRLEEWLLRESSCLASLVIKNGRPRLALARNKISLAIGK